MGPTDRREPRTYLFEKKLRQPSGFYHSCTERSACLSQNTYTHPLPHAAISQCLQGELAFRAVSYTPYPVEEGVEGERLRIEVGPTDRRVPRTYLFEKKLRQPSKLLTVTLPRPLGIVLEEDKRRKRVVVSGTITGSRAEQKAQLAKVDRARQWEAPLPGDVLRACTCTTLMYPANSLILGMQPPQRYVVLYGADGQRWEKVSIALKRGLVSDGPVTLVLERPIRETT